MAYKFGRKSLIELQGVHPDLVDVIKYALKISSVDFSVHDGLRTSDEQYKLFKNGVSTKDGEKRRSKHQVQKDSWGHAVDIVPYVNKKLRWEWEAIYPVAEAIKLAGEELKVKIRWGGCWTIITNKSESTRDLQHAYVMSRLKENRQVFSDGAHYEIKI